MENELMRREVEEAVVAGERALSSLESAAEKLSSARNWGLFDMFGGGFISGMMKHSRINDATIYMENAKNQLQIFQRELKDIHVPMDFQLEIGTFLTFTDFSLMILFQIIWCRAVSGKRGKKSVRRSVRCAIFSAIFRDYWMEERRDDLWDVSVIFYGLSAAVLSVA